MKHSKYALSSEVFICLADKHVFFLDLKRDRYCALEAARTAGLSRLVAGWPVHACGAPAASDANDNALAESLVRKGLLCQDESGTKDAAPVKISRPAVELLREPSKISGGLRTGRIFTILALYALAAIRFRCCSLETLINRVRRQRQTKASGSPILDLNRAQQLIDDFRRLRPLLFSARDSCLFESYFLIEVLAHYGLFPNWIFGIQPTPFVAHCWVQQDAILFNDRIDRIERFSPIMVV